MKTLIDETKRKYLYNCDRCKKEISFKDKTLHKIRDQYSERKNKKICDLCNSCYKALIRGVFKKGEQKR